MDDFLPRFASPVFRLPNYNTLALAVAVAGCGATDAGEARWSGVPEEPARDMAAGGAESLAPANPDSVIARWGLPDGAVARLGRGAVEGYGFTPDGRWLVISSGVGLWYYSIATGEPAALEAKGMPPEGGDDAPDGTVFEAMRRMSFKPGMDVRSRDGTTLASAVGDTIRVRDVSTGAIRFEKRVGEPVRALAYRAEPFTLAAASGSDIIMWRGRDGDSASISRGEEDPDYFDSGVIRLWDLETGRTDSSRALAFPTGHCCLDWGNMAFSPDGSMLAAGGFETVLLWDVATGQSRVELEDPDRSGNVVAVAFSPDGGSVGLRWRNDPGHIWLWDVASGALRDIGSEAHLSLTPVGMSADGGILATHSQWDASFSYEGWRHFGGETSMVQFWDPRTGRRYNSVPLHGEGGVTSPIFSPDFRTMASGVSMADRGGSFGYVFVHDIRTGESLELWHDNVIDSVAFSPDGRILASWMRAENHLAETFDETIRLWDVATGELLLAASEDTVVSLEDPETSERLATVTGGSVAFPSAAVISQAVAIKLVTTPAGDTAWLFADREVEATAQGGSIILERVSIDAR